MGRLYFIENFVLISLKTLKFLAYASGHLLFVATIFSIIAQNELMFRTIVDGSFVGLLLYAILGIVIIGVVGGFLIALATEVRTQMLALRAGLVMNRRTTRRQR